MAKKWQERCAKKIVSASKAISKIRPGDRVFVGSACGEPQELVRALTDADFEGAATRQITHVAGDARLEQTGADYLRLFALPNLWFHLSMAFAIARRSGLPVGKADYDGWHQYAPGFSFVSR